MYMHFMIENSFCSVMQQYFNFKLFCCRKNKECSKKKKILYVLELKKNPMF